MKNKRFELLKEQCKDMTILYVEDELDVAEIITDILSNIFKKVITASNGKIGLEKRELNENIDIIITDVKMPIKNGLDMIADIRKFDDDISILIISANNNTDYFLDIIRYGIDGYLVKPLDYEQFITTLLKATQKVVLRKQNEIYKQHLELKVIEKTSQLEHKYYTDELTGLKK